MLGLERMLLDRAAPIGSWETVLPVEPDGDWLAAPCSVRDYAQAAHEAVLTGQRLPRERPARIRPGAGMLEEFVRLWDRDDDAVASYAATWGLLGLCEHGRGARHGELPGEPDTAQRCRPASRESILRWRQLSLAASEILTAAAELHQGRKPAFERAYPAHLLHGPDAPRAASVPPPWMAKGLVGAAIGVFLQDGGCSTALRWGLPKNSTAGPQFTVMPHSLLAAVGVQLALAIARTDGLAFCSACGRAYPPKRRPQAGRRNYCPDCGVQAARRDAARDFAARRLEQKGS